MLKALKIVISLIYAHILKKKEEDTDKMSLTQSYSHGDKNFWWKVISGDSQKAFWW